MIRNEIISWLLASKPYIKYQTLTSLMTTNATQAETENSYKEMVSQPEVKTLLDELQNWNKQVLKRHNDAAHLIHKLAFLADIGIKPSEPAIKQVCEKILDTQTNDGVFPVPINIPVRFGGKGQNQLTWMLCDAPTVVYALVKFGYTDNEKVQQACDVLINKVFENGWRCTASPDLGKFRGPGRKNDYCPYANLLMLKLIAQLPARQQSKHAEQGVQAFFNHWMHQREQKPYLFGIGTDFRKPKAPFIWFDILHVMEVLSQYPHLRKHPIVQEMTEIIKSRRNAEGKIKAQSVYRAWKSWDFGQKRQPSQWITLIGYKILKRLEER